MTDFQGQDSYTDHDGGAFAAVHVKVVATWSAPTFAENLAIDSAGAIFGSLYSHNRIDRYDPATGATAPFAELPAPPVDLAFDADGSLWAPRGTFRRGPGYIWRNPAGIGGRLKSRRARQWFDYDVRHRSWRVPAQQ